MLYMLVVIYAFCVLQGLIQVLEEKAQTIDHRLCL